MKNILDDFDNKLKDRLSDIKMEPSADMWSRIEKSLNEQEKISIARKRIYLGRVIVSASIAALFILGVFILTNREFEDEEEVIAVFENEMVENIITTESSIKIALNNDFVETVIKVKNNDFSPRKTETSNLSPDYRDVDTTHVDKSKHKKEKRNKGLKEVAKKSNRTYETTNYISANIESRDKPKNRLSFSVEAGGFSGSSESMVAPRMLNLNNEPYRPVNNSPTSRDMDRNWVHAMPISFSISVRKMIYGNIGIESGLALTHLSSHSNAISSKDADLKNRHTYIGIPVNVVFSIMQNEKFNFYAKAGLLVDKSICSKSYSMLKGVEKTSDLSRDGVQLSYNLNLGGEYTVLKNISLYLEPSLSFYADSKQPISYRTENNHGFNVVAGLRFRL